jgi:rod shape-determining protein MreD
MTLWLLIPFLGLVAVAQATLVPLVAIGGYKVDLPLLVIVAWGLLGPLGEAAVWGFIVGLFMDLTSGLPFGTQTIALTSIGLLMGLAQTTLFHTNVILPPAATAIATFGYDLLILAILSTIGWHIGWSDYIFRVILPTAILNTIVLPVTYFPLQRLQHRLRPEMEW